MDLFGVFAEPKTEEKLECLPDELEDAFQATQIVTTPMQPNLEEEQITVYGPTVYSTGHCKRL